MATDLGKIAQTLEGEYTSSKIYNKLDTVSYEGSSYTSKLDNNDKPVSDSVFWQLTAQKGDAGQSFNHKGSISNYSELPTTGNVLNDAYYNLSDLKLYVYNGSSFPASGNGIILKGQDGTNGTASIPKWSAQSYISDAMVIKDNLQYLAPSGALSTDVPGVSVKWLKIGGADFNEEQFNEEAQKYGQAILISKDLSAINFTNTIPSGAGSSIFTYKATESRKIGKLRVKITTAGNGNFKCLRSGVVSPIISSVPLVPGWNDVTIDFEMQIGDYIGYSTATSTATLQFRDGTGGLYYLINETAINGNIALEVYDKPSAINTFEQIVKADLSNNGDILIELADEGLTNLFNINDVTIQNDKAINPGFNIGDFGGFKLSGWISVQPNTQYSWLKYGLGGKNMQYTNVAKVKIGGKVVGVQGGTYVKDTFTTPADCFGIYYTIKSSGESNIPPELMLVKGNGLKSDGTEVDFIAFGNSEYVGNEIIAKSSNIILADKLKNGAKIGDKTVASIDDIPDYLSPLPANFNTVVASGTSITVGIGSNGGAGVDEAKTWRYVLQTTLSNVLGRSITVVNGGVSGQNTTGMKNNFTSLISGSGKVVIIEGAINDAQTAGVGLSIQTTISNLSLMIDSAIAAGHVPILTTPMPIDLSAPGMAVAYTNQKRSDLSFAVRKLAKQKGVRLVDFDALSNSDFTLMVDGLHPNPKGYLWMANYLTSVFI